MYQAPSNKNTDLGGVSARKTVLPVAVFIAVLHVIIVVLIFQINNTSSKLSMNMRAYNTYVSDATALIAGSSLRCETTNTFVLMPVLDNGQVNLYPLEAFAEEMGQGRTGSQVADRFRDYDVSKEAKKQIYQAGEHSDRLLETQLHAIALVDAVYPVPETRPFTDIPMAELTEEEKSMSDSDKLAVARNMILGTEYSAEKDGVSQSVAAAVGTLKEESGRQSATMRRRISILRILVWTVTITIILVLLIVFVMFYRLLIIPLYRFVRLIGLGQSVSESQGLKEVRLVASAYNDLLWQKDSLEEILKSAAEKDPGIKEMLEEAEKNMDEQT